ncbi:MAG: NAD(P)/FAD-dependent oxidoreductase [Actinobacteria bacterium]|nr:NAD(P)/FAD-dependent oxidoreductase [Actinomycetota bacterium]
METEFDVIVIGAGPAGEVLAGRVAERRDMSVAIVERELVGGECSFYACMPSKALLRPAEVLAEVARVPGAAEAAGGPLDVAAVLRRRDEIVGHLRDDRQLPWLEERGVELIRGHARLEGERRVRVGADTLMAREAVVIAVGSGALVPPIPGLAEAAAWSNREITTAGKAPESLVVLGGGVVGVEMAQAWSSLGTQVTVIEAMDGLLPREEPFAGEELRAALEEHDIEVRVGARAAVVGRAGDGYAVRLESGEVVGGERLLVAVGRRPLTADLGLEAVGLEPGRYLEVDDALRVGGREWLYAVGDVNGRSLLTHSGKYQARVAADNILGSDRIAVADGAGAPRVVFTDPQVAAVGHTLQTALAAEIAAEAIDLPTAGTAGASFHGRGAPGTTRFVLDREREVLVGVTFVGPEVADLLHAATIAIAAEVPIASLADAVPAFPTRSELWLKFIEAHERERLAPPRGAQLVGAGGPA